MANAKCPVETHKRVVVRKSGLSALKGFCEVYEFNIPHNIVRIPILGVLGTPGKSYPISMTFSCRESWNDVTGAQDSLRIDEFEGIFLGHWRKLDAIKLTCVPAVRCPRV